MCNVSSFQLVKENSLGKGDVLTVSEVAGVLGAKKTPELIPLCHPLGAMELIRTEAALDPSNEGNIEWTIN